MITLQNMLDYTCLFIHKPNTLFKISTKFHHNLYNVFHIFTTFEIVNLSFRLPNKFLETFGIIMNRLNLFLKHQTDVWNASTWQNYKFNFPQDVRLMMEKWSALSVDFEYGNNFRHFITIPKAKNSSMLTEVLGKVERFNLEK